MTTITSPAAGRSIVRRIVAAGALACLAALPGAGIQAAADAEAGRDVRVTEARGTYTVKARFRVDDAAAAVATLTDYERIPEFMPDVRKSVILERSGTRMVVEQEAESKMMMFSRRVHLRLDVERLENVITFQDRCRSSFKRYAGSWTVSETPSGTFLTYELVAEPAFDVPGFLLKRLLRRDSSRMIERLQAEISRRRQAELTGGTVRLELAAQRLDRPRTF